MLSSRYRIVGLLGRGGMGEVYRADDLELGQSVALKFLPEKVARDAMALERFRREVRTARQVAHANVCRVYDIAKIDGHVFLSMEYIDGEDLSHALRRLGRPSREKAIEIARQLCLGLASAHENGVLHRDLKPANVMIDGRGRVRITDFGLAGLADELAATPERAGTPAYMAPEQLESGKVSVRSDVYSLGLILYEVFTGKRAFVGESLEELKRIRTSGPVTTPSSLPEHLDPAVERVILRCLEADPQSRPSSVYAVLGALPGGDPLAAALAAGETPSPELVANAAVQGGLKPLLAVALLLAVIVLAIGGAYLRTRITVQPAKPPEALSAQAEQILEELGYRNLPGNTVRRYATNGALVDWLREHPAVEPGALESNWRPVYTFWRRWSPGSLLPNKFHDPQDFGLDDPPPTLPGSTSIVLDSNGRLLGLSIIPEPSDPGGTTVRPDWQGLLQRAMIDESEATPTEPTKHPPAYSDEIVAWQVQRPQALGGPFVAQAGAVGGRPNYFEIVGPGVPAQVPEGRGRIAAMIRESLLAVFYGVSIFLAWRSLRLGRGDRKSAFRCALATLSLYALCEILSLRTHETAGIYQITGLLWNRAAGHMVMHALSVWMMYLAIEPYVRRIWPRALVGVVRLLDGRLRDPLVGREVLIGTVAGLGVASFGVVADLLARSAGQGGRAPFLPTINVSLLSDPSWFVIRVLQGAITWPIVSTVFMVTVLLVIHLVTGRNWATAILGGTLLGFTLYSDANNGTTAPLAALAQSAAYGLLMVFVITRVGVLAAYVVECMVQLVLFYGPPLTTDLLAWYGPYAIAGFVLIFSVACYGFWLALARQPILRDILAAEKPTRA
jgi:serine/threonine-protein kinase